MSVVTYRFITTTKYRAEFLQIYKLIFFQVCVCVHAQACRQHRLNRAVRTALIVGPPFLTSLETGSLLFISVHATCQLPRKDSCLAFRSAVVVLESHIDSVGLISLWMRTKVFRMVWPVSCQPGLYKFIKTKQCIMYYN